MEQQTNQRLKAAWVSVIGLWAVTWTGVIQMRHDFAGGLRAHHADAETHYSQHPELYAASGWAETWKSFPSWEEAKGSYGPDDFRFVIMPLVIFAHGQDPVAGEDAFYLWLGIKSVKLMAIREWMS